MTPILIREEFNKLTPVRYVRTCGDVGTVFALYCDDNKVFLCDRRRHSKVFLVSDAELFLTLVGLRFVIVTSRGRKLSKQELVD